MPFDLTYSVELGTDFPTAGETLREAAIQAQRVGSGIRGALSRLVAANRTTPFLLDADREAVYEKVSANVHAGIVNDMSRLLEGGTRAERIMERRRA